MEQMSFRQYINRKYDIVKGLIEMNCIILKIEFKNEILHSRCRCDWFVNRTKS